MTSPHPTVGAPAFSATLALLTLVSTGPADARLPTTLDREAVIAAARERAPAVLRAFARLQRAEAQLVRAGMLSERNPSAQFRSGPRIGNDLSLSAEGRLFTWLPVPLLLDRAAATRAAEAGVEQAELDVEAVRIGAVGAALDAYVGVLHAKDRLALAHDRAALAEELVASARARVEAGSASRLEVEVAEAELASSRSGVLAAEAELTSRTQSLAFLLDRPELAPADVGGSLQEQLTPLSGDGPEIDALIAKAQAERPDVRAADAAVERAEAEVRRAALAWLPEVNVGAGYGYEEGNHIPALGVGVSLPLYDHGQDERAEARAALSAHKVEAGLTRRALRVEIARAVRAHRKMLAAVRIMEEQGLPRASAAEELMATSYRAGKAGLPELLVVRRDTLAIRADHLSRQLAAALAANQVVVVVGALSSQRSEP